MKQKIVLDPVLSCEMINPSVDKLADKFEKGFDVLYVYGPPGTGKTLAIELLSDEFDIFLYKLEEPIDDVKRIIGVSRGGNLLDKRRQIVVVDSIDTWSKKDLELLSKGHWNNNSLILVGESFPRASNPIKPFTKSKQYKFDKIKFDKIDDRELSRVVLKMAIANKSVMTQENMKKIVDSVNGDLRKCISVTKNFLLGGGVDIDGYLPFSEVTDFNRVRRMLSGDYDSALEEIEGFGWFYSIMILAENLENKKDNEELMNLVMSLSKSKVEDREKILALIAVRIHKKYAKGPYTKWVFPKRAAKVEKSDIEACCSDIKKDLYFI